MTSQPASPFDHGRPDPAPVVPAAEPRPLTEARPEILIGAAAAGGFIFAKLLGRVRGR
ncbi:unannotated protein [freshwater metagenome]|uniref:Unannotated protein n=1 Tax=freshwater metagenome TaxID=449393 RepID=A0A6J7HMB5_9ZZZZ|nr:hypothetical protein [Actinomycetota bacterium]